MAWALGFVAAHTRGGIVIELSLPRDPFRCYLRWTVTEFEEVWNPSNGEIWVLQKVAGQGTYELCGRWHASRQSNGRFADVKYGRDRNQEMPGHMKRPLPSRLVTPEGLAGDEHELIHLQNLPGPTRWQRGEFETWRAERW